MPRVKWGAGAGGDALTAADIDSVEPNEYQPYAGEIPPSGVYRFRLRRAKKTESSNNNPMVKILWVLDGSWKPEHKKYDGCPMWTQVMVMKSTAFQVRAFCDALGLTSSEFLTKVVVDEDDEIQRIGGLDIAGQDLLVYINAKRGAYEGTERLETSTGYLPLTDDESEEDEDLEDDEEPEAEEADEEEADEDEEEADEDEEPEPEPEPAPRRAIKKAAPAAPAKKAAPAAPARKAAPAKAVPAKKAATARRREAEAPF